MQPSVYCSIIYNSQVMEATQVSSIDEWIKKMWWIGTMEYDSAIKQNFAICNNMDGAREYYAKQSKSERQIPPDSTHKWNLRNKTKGSVGERERQTKKPTCKYRDQTDGYQKEGRWGDV